MEFAECSLLGSSSKPLRSTLNQTCLWVALGCHDYPVRSSRKIKEQRNNVMTSGVGVFMRIEFAQINTIEGTTQTCCADDD